MNRERVNPGERNPIIFVDQPVSRKTHGWDNEDKEYLKEMGTSELKHHTSRCRSPSERTEEGFRWQTSSTNESFPFTIRVLDEQIGPLPVRVRTVVLHQRLWPSEVHFPREIVFHPFNEVLSLSICNRHFLSST